MINIILAEGYNIVRIGVRALLEKDGGFNILAEGINGIEVLNYVNDGGKIADIVLAGLTMPGMGGLELAEKLRKVSPKVKVVIFTTNDTDKSLNQALKAGVSGYLLKNVSAEELIFSLKHIHNSGRYICAELAMRLVDRMVIMPDPVLAIDGLNNYDLTTKEQDALVLIAEGYTNQEIAEKVFTSKRTIEGYRQSLMTKTGSRNTAALIKFAIKNGLIN